MQHDRQIDWTIRPATAAEEPVGRKGFALVAVAEDDTPIARAHVLESDGWFHLLEMSVAPPRRRSGIGTALLAAVESEVIDRGASALTLVAPEPAAVPFFARLGFAEPTRLPVGLRDLIADVHGPSGPDDRAVAMGKWLAPDVIPRPAVSVIPLRDGAGGLEVFAQHRVATMDFAAGAVVFPGGRVDPADAATSVVAPTEHAPAWARTSLPSADTLVAAAIREVAEECGVLLEPAALVPWDNWVTPPGGRRRFDVAFFVTAVPAAESGRWGNTTTEAVRAVWEPVTGLLSAYAAGTVRLLSPTAALLAELAGFGTCAEVLAHAPLITAVLDDEPPRPAGGAAPVPLRCRTAGFSSGPVRHRYDPQH